ncbi:unnamed protein product [Cylindrotheca closterium]|uniref:Amino acid transporter transmembrane domain-containing protein n=1 Tax=Cylindrotheca closterium TaxID=2856 RepID=A0AAD2PV23_9STRA|nr:unnamed protein product [Cylindrotheca closterium]
MRLSGLAKSFYDVAFNSTVPPDVARSDLVPFTVHGFAPRDITDKVRMPVDEKEKLVSASSSNYGSGGMHLKTYTAGEDNSRLKEMAKQFGLENQRLPRNQVRARVNTPLSTLTGFYYERLLDPGFADVRMRAIFSARAHSEQSFDDEGKMLMGRLPTWKEDDAGETLEAADPHAHGLGGDMTSAVLGIIKGMVGPAILYLPHGFANAGYVASIPILIIATILFLSSSACLLDSWKHESLKEKRSSNTSRIILSYPELAYRGLGYYGETAVKIGIALMQSGVCLTYIIFVSLNLQTCTNVIWGTDLPASYFTIIMLLFQIPLSWIRDIRKLTLTNLIANVLILYGLIACLSFAFEEAASSKVGRPPLEEIAYKFHNLDAFNSGWFLFIGTSVLLFEGSITLLVPLQEAVYREEDRERFPVVYQRVILGIIAFYTFFGLTCWMAFGDDVRTVMTTSLPSGTLATTVQLAYSFAVIFTFPLQNFPSLEIACRSIASCLESTCGEGSSSGSQRNVIATLLVCLLGVIAAMTMESLDKLVSLMGSLIGCPLAFLLPPMIHNNIDPSLSKSRRVTNNIVSFLGLCAMVLASVTTILTW